jgi:nucleotide-binding universal stress UspA family protein
VATKVLSVSGKTLLDAKPDPRPTVGVLDVDISLQALHQRLDDALPAIRPRAKLGGLAATRAAEREAGRARVENSTTLADMRGHAERLRVIAREYQAARIAAGQDRHLSDAGVADARAKLRRTFEEKLVDNEKSYEAKETELLASFHGRGKLWQALREKSGPVQATVAAAQGVAALLGQYAPEEALAVLEQAIDERDLVTLHYVTRVVKNLVASDERFGSLTGEAETLLADAALASGDEASDASEYARALAAAMREQLVTTSKLVGKNGNFDPVLDSAGLLSAFAVPGVDGDEAENARRFPRAAAAHARDDDIVFLNASDGDDAADAPGGGSEA